MSEPSSGKPTLLVVGKGSPYRGGIPSYLDAFLSSELAAEHNAVFLNVAHNGAPEGGRPTFGNLTRTLRDIIAVWNSSRGRSIVHIHSAAAPLLTLLRAGGMAAAARARGSRVLLHAHGGQVQIWLQTAFRRRFARLLLAPFDGVLAVSTGGRDALESVLGAHRVTLIPNGVNVDLYGPPEAAHEPPRLLYVGILTPRKGLLDLIDASTRLRAQGLAHELWVVGGTPDEGAAAETTVRSAAGPEVRFLGQVPHSELPAIYRQADLFCLPSWWEAMPLTVLEAMAAGLPVVASDVGDVSTMVQHGINGLVVRPRDPQALSEALGELLLDRSLRLRMGDAGRSRVVTHFSQQSALDALSNVYRQTGATRR